MHMVIVAARVYSWFILHLWFFIYLWAYLFDHYITYLFYTYLDDEVGLVEYFVLTLLLLMFLAADPDYMSEDCE
jgi:hypothetical protein